MSDKLHTVSVQVTDKARQKANMSLKVSKTLIDTLLSNSNWDKFRALANKYSYGKVTKRAQQVAQTYSLPSVGDVWWKNEHKGMDTVDSKAHLTFRFTADGETITMSIPAPQQSMYEEVEGVGIRVKRSTGDDIAKEMKAILGKDVQFVRGSFSGNSRRNNSI